MLLNVFISIHIRYITGAVLVFHSLICSASSGFLGFVQDFWVAVKELNSSVYIGETVFIYYIYIHIPIMVTLFKFLNSNQDSRVAGTG